MLNSHPDICCHGEVMAGAIQSFVGLESEQHSPLATKLEILREQNPEAFILDFVMFGGNSKAVGFKIKYEELVLKKFVPVLRTLQYNLKIKIIHLLRKNRLKRFVSKITATRIYNVYNIFDITQKPQIKTFVLDPVECENDFLTTEARENEFRAAFADHQLLEIFYEDLLNPNTNTQREIQNFLEVQPVELKTATIKINPDKIQILIENFTELKAYFNKTRWKNLFEDN